MQLNQFYLPQNSQNLQRGRGPNEFRWRAGSGPWAVDCRPLPYDDTHGWLKNQNNLLEPIWQVGRIFPSALVNIVDSRGGVEDKTFKAKTNDLKRI